MADKYLLLREIAAELRISRETARQAVLDGSIPAKQVRGPGSTWRGSRHHPAQKQRLGSRPHNERPDCLVLLRVSVRVG